MTGPTCGRSAGGSAGLERDLAPGRRRRGEHDVVALEDFALGELDARALLGERDLRDGRAEPDALLAERCRRASARAAGCRPGTGRPRCRSRTSRGRRPSPPRGSRGSSASSAATPLSPASWAATAARHSGDASSAAIHSAVRPLVERRRVRRLPGHVGVDGRRVRVHLRERGPPCPSRASRTPPRRALAVQDDGRLVLGLAHVEELEAELLLVGDPGRVIAPDQLAAALHGLPGDHVGERHDAAADARAGLDDRHVVSGGHQLEGAGEPREARADDDDPLAGRRPSASSPGQIPAGC